VDVILVVNSTNITSISNDSIKNMFNIPAPFFGMVATYSKCIPQVQLNSITQIPYSSGFVPESTFAWYSDQYHLNKNLIMPAFVLDIGITSEMDLQEKYCAHHYKSHLHEKPYMVLSPYLCDPSMLSLFFQHEVSEVIADPLLQSQFLEIADPCVKKPCTDSKGESYVSIYVRKKGCVCNVASPIKTPCTVEMNTVSCNDEPIYYDPNFFTAGFDTQSSHNIKVGSTFPQWKGREETIS
jgi:hypothetical protein